MYFQRNNLEDKEAEGLASYATLSKNSAGRLTPEDEPEFRTVFQRDRDRILHTTAFRRLEYKTQVFISYEGDYYRTRLTHTLEVAQMGRTISRALGVNEDLVEAIALAHDLGHPPFGHSGERTLAKIMREYEGFDHNRQSYRIVTQLEKRFPDFNGLNLTKEVLEGIVKHETEYDRADAKGFNPYLRAHLEAQITNAADELAYTAHDLDDGIRSGILIPEMLGEIEWWEILIDSVGISGKVIDDLARHRIIRRLIGIQMKDLLQATEHNIELFKIRTAMDVQTAAVNLISFSEEIAKHNRELKDFLYHNLYRHYRVLRMSYKAERILQELFDAYQKETAILPRHIQNNIEIYGIERTICDYIAGMTDRFAIEEHQRLFSSGTLP